MFTPCSYLHLFCNNFILNTLHNINEYWDTYFIFFILHFSFNFYDNFQNYNNVMSLNYN